MSRQLSRLAREIVRVYQRIGMEMVYCRPGHLHRVFDGHVEIATLAHKFRKAFKVQTGTTHGAIVALKDQLEKQHGLYRGLTDLAAHMNYGALIDANPSILKRHRGRMSWHRATADACRKRGPKWRVRDKQGC